MSEAVFSREQICAHRGASGAYPENTHAAFNAAASVGAGWIETDIQCLADDELVIFHDAHLGRTAPGAAKVTSLSWPDMADLNVGSWKGRRWSVQQQVVITLQRGRRRVNSTRLVVDSVVGSVVK